MAPKIVVFLGPECSMIISNYSSTLALSNTVSILPIFFMRMTQPSLLDSHQPLPPPAPNFFQPDCLVIMMATWIASERLADSGRNKQLNWKMPTRWSSNVSSGLPMRRSVIELGKRKNQNANIVRRRSTMRVRVWQSYCRLSPQRKQPCTSINPTPALLLSFPT
jgi:hypothetical protein